MWKNEDMEKAIEAVKSEENSISAASKKFNAPRKTLDDRIKGRVNRFNADFLTTVGNNR